MCVTALTPGTWSLAASPPPNFRVLPGTRPLEVPPPRSLARMPSSGKRRRASTDSSPPEWWSHGGQGGSIDGHADRGSLMLANILGLPLAEFHREYWLQRPYLKQLTPAQGAALPRSHPARMLPMDTVKALLRRRKPRPARFTHDVDVTC